jgi:G3E family GTPase
VTLNQKIRATVLTGFLGAGKTTLLNRILRDAATERTAIIVNEFGEVGIDGQLVIETQEGVIELNNGCICCTIRGDLTDAIHALIDSGRPLDRIIIETSGLADPAPVLQTFLLDDGLKAAVMLDAVVTVVDARHFPLHADDEIVREQVAFADVVILNKTDLESPAAVDAIEASIRRLNPLARLHRTRACEAPLDAVLDVAAFDLKNLLHIDPQFLEAHDHEHDSAITSIAMGEVEPLDAAAVSQWLAAVTQGAGRDLLRVKGILNLAGEARRYVFHGVHMTLDGQPGRPWEDCETRQSQVVFIGRNLDLPSLQQGFSDCRVPALQLAS